MVELIEEIRNWQQLGELLLVMGDFNDDTAQPSFKQRMQEVGLVDALASLHRQPHLPTYNRGATPIDAIYASPGLLLGASGGYLEFEDGLLSNHRGLWLDLRKEILWGGKDNLCVGGHARRLKCEDPHVVKKYNKHLLASIQKFKLLEKVDQLQQMEHIKAAELDNIDQQLTSVHLEAEKHCHKIKAGRVAWCPMLMQAIQAIQYWKAWLKRALGGVISNNILQKRARLARIKHEAHGATPMQDTIKKRIATAYQTFKRIKGQAD